MLYLERREAHSSPTYRGRGILRDFDETFEGSYTVSIDRNGITL